MYTIMAGAYLESFRPFWSVAVAEELPEVEKRTEEELRELVQEHKKLQSPTLGKGQFGQ